MHNYLDHHKNGIFSFRYLIPHSCDSSLRVKSFLSRIPSYSISPNYSFIVPIYLFLSIQRSLRESSLGKTVPPSQLEWLQSDYLESRSIAL